MAPRRADGASDAYSIAALQDWLSDSVVRRLIGWIMGWPAGFKLNDALDRFIGALFLVTLDTWSAFVHVSRLLVSARPVRVRRRRRVDAHALCRNTPNKRLSCSPSSPSARSACRCSWR